MTDPARSLAERTCLVTGASAGIGAVLARELARRGARVVLVGRSEERCRAAAQSIRGATGNEAVEFLVADLAMQAEVRRLAREFRARHDRLHVLIHCAGALHALREETAEGIERTFALNYLAVFLLTSLLLETLEASRPARIVNLTSSVHADVPGFDFDDPQALSAGKHYGRSELRSLLYGLFLPWRHPGVAQYARTKLAVLLFTRELARRLTHRGVTVNAVHPGFVRTRFMDGNGSYGWFMRRWAGLFGKDAEAGARTPLLLATAPELEGVTGEYFVDGRIALPSAAARDDAGAARLWELSEQWTLVGAR